MSLNIFILCVENILYVLLLQEICQQYQIYAKFLLHVTYFGAFSVIYQNASIISISYPTTQLLKILVLHKKKTTILLRQLTNFMELSPSSKAASCATTQELSSTLRNPKVHYRIHKSLPLVPILSQINLVLTTLSYLPNIHFNIIHPFTSWSS
jgi:hypothetical protein